MHDLKPFSEGSFGLGKFSRIKKLKDVHSVMYLPKVDDSTWRKLLDFKKDLSMGFA